MDREALAGAAGLFDGEGCFHLVTRRKGARLEAWTQTRMTQEDREVLDRFAAAVRCGRVYGPYTSVPGRRRARWQYAAYGFERAQAILAMLWPWLGPIKKSQASTVLRQVHAHWDRRRPSGPRRLRTETELQRR
jgi:hypothetical protein